MPGRDRRDIRTPAQPAASAFAVVTAIALVSAFAPRPAASQNVQPQTPPPPRAGVADTVTILPTVEVDSRAEDLRARTVTHLDSTVLKRFKPANVADALLAAPGVDLVRSGPWAERVSVRGLSGDRILVLVDGLPLSSGRGHGAQTSLLSVDNLESVDLSPGAGGASYGQDALGGVVSINTLAPILGADDRGEIAFSTRFTEPGGGRSAWARLRESREDKALELAGTVAGLESMTVPGGTLDNSGYEEYDLRARGALRLGRGSLDASYSRHAAFDIGLPIFNNAAGSQAEYPLQARDALRLEWIDPGKGVWPASRVLAFHQGFDTRFVETTVDSQFLRGQFVASRTTRSDDAIDTNVNGLEPNWSKGPLQLTALWRHEATGGPRTTDLTVQNAAGAVTSATVTTGESVPDATRTSLGAGVLAKRDAWTAHFEGGLRYDAIHSRADSTATSHTTELDVTDKSWSGDLGVSRPVGAFVPYARFATGFRAPNLEERYFNNSLHGGLRVFGNPDLVSERSQTYELGTRALATWQGVAWDARASVYRSNVRELISLAYIGQLYRVPRFEYQNIERARLDGIEVSAGGRRGPRRMQSALSVPRGKDLETGEALTDYSAPRASIDLGYAWTRLGPDGAVWLRTRGTDATISVVEDLNRPASWTASAEVSGSLRGIQASFAIQNLTNEFYREPMSFLPESGRQFVVTLGSAWGRGSGGGSH